MVVSIYMTYILFRIGQESQFIVLHFTAVQNEEGLCKSGPVAEDTLVGMLELHRWCKSA